MAALSERFEKQSSSKADQPTVTVTIQTRSCLYCVTPTARRWLRSNVTASGSFDLLLHYPQQYSQCTGTNVQHLWTDNTASISSLLHSIPREHRLVLLPSYINHQLNWYHSKGFEPIPYFPKSITLLSITKVHKSVRIHSFPAYIPSSRQLNLHTPHIRIKTMTPLRHHLIRKIINELCTLYHTPQISRNASNQPTKHPKKKEKKENIYLPHSHRPSYKSPPSDP